MSSFVQAPKAPDMAYACDVILLKLLPLGLIASRIRMAGIAWKIKLVDGYISVEVLTDEDDPGLFSISLEWRNSYWV